MIQKKDNPGVYLPPPLIYLGIFFLSVLIQKKILLSTVFFETKIALVFGWIFIILGIIFILPAIIKFFKTKNTLVTIKPANSLQTSGVYSTSRNPMYLGLLMLYIGMAFFKGNSWTLIFIPVVILVITYFVIRKEEKYLTRAFGNDYIEYRKKVRRWI